MADRIRAGVAGAGVFGGYHANKYVEAEGAELVAIYDVDRSRAEEGAAKHQAKGTDSFTEFLSLCDVVTIATPASTHGALAEQALAAGKHVLVEKPIALDLEMADKLIALSNEKDVVLQVGHQERYVADAFGLFDRGAPKMIRSRRLNKFSGRAMDVSVVFDLMIHDLDLLAILADAETAEITHFEARAEHGPLADYVDVALRTSSGVAAHLTASRLEESPNRDLGMTFGDGEIVLDFLKREIANTTATPMPVDFASEDKPRALADPLAYGTESFVEAVRTGRQPTVGGRAGRRALSLALMIENAAQTALKDKDA